MAGVASKMLVFLVLTRLIVLPVHAREPCFLLAASYYEQIYCEVKAKGQGSKLPRFYDFQNNNQTTQALLLKRHARKLGIALSMPEKPSPAIRQQRSPLQSPRPQVSGRSSLAGCKLSGVTILCGDATFKLIGNLANKHLGNHALSDSNQFILPHYRGTSNTELQRYLVDAYRRYLDKMLEIGLGGSTMTFTKFSYLYFDLTEKGADFVERSKTVFNYLKIDKKRIAVSETISPAVTLTLRHCSQLYSDLIACDGGRKNYLYRAHNQ